MEIRMKALLVQTAGFLRVISEGQIPTPVYTKNEASQLLKQIEDLLDSTD